MGEILKKITTEKCRPFETDEVNSYVSDRADDWLQRNATMYRGNNASTCMVNAYIAGAKEIINDLVSNMNIPTPKLQCKRHYWKSGWICEKCGMKRTDYEHTRSMDRAKYYVVNYGKNKIRKFKCLRQAKEFASCYLHDGHEDFKVYNIVRISNLTKRVVCQHIGNVK